MKHKIPLKYLNRYAYISVYSFDLWLVHMQVIKLYVIDNIKHCHPTAQFKLQLNLRLQEYEMLYVICNLSFFKGLHSITRGIVFLNVAS